MSKKSYRMIFDNSPDVKKIFSEVLDRWSDASQWSLLVEEMSELSADLMRVLNDRKKLDADSLKELSDVIVMVNQCHMMLSDLEKDIVADNIQEVLEQLQNTLNRPNSWDNTNPRNKE